METDRTSGASSLPPFIDVAGGHGVVALCLLAYGLTRKVTIVDPFRPASFGNAHRALAAAGLLPSSCHGGDKHGESSEGERIADYELVYDERPLAEALPELLASAISSGTFYSYHA